MTEVIMPKLKRLQIVAEKVNVTLSLDKRPKALSEAALRLAVKKIADKGYIREAFHSEVERASRNISDEDVRYGLERKDWVLAREPNWDDDPKHKNWEYLIKTVDIDQIPLHLKIVIYPSENRLRVITKY